MTGSISSTTTPMAGRLVCIALVRSGGTAWTGSPFTLIGPKNAFILSQRLVDDATARIIIYTGDLAGNVMISDTLNLTNSYSFTTSGTRTQRTPTGTQYYVSGGIPNPRAPTAVINGTGGTTTRMYQIIARNSAGTTQGFSTADEFPIPNSPTITTWQDGPGIIVLNGTNATQNGSNNTTLTWEAVSGATSYDLITSTDGSTWTSMTGSLALSALTYTDTGLTRTAYSLPASNTTALGNNSSAGTASNTAWATMAKAASVAVSGDGISCTGFICDSGQVVFASGVIITGPATFYSTLTGTTRVCYLLPSHGDVSDIAFKTDTTAYIVGSSTSDAAVVDCYLYRCSGFTSSQHIWRFSTTSYFEITDWNSISYHGSMGVQGSDAVVNLVRGSLFASDLPITITHGFLMMRDFRAVSVYDFLNIAGSSSFGLQISASGANGCGLMMINSFVFGQVQDINLPNTTNLKGIWARNTPTSAAIAASVTSSDAGTYVPDTTVAGNGTFSLSRPVNISYH